jgi:alkylation response protein AidB-like acyl-CoA dehydrogenase
MMYELPEELKMLQQTMRRFVEKECRPLERQLCYEDPDWVELPKEMADHLTKVLKDNGLWALYAKEEYGGGGLNALGMVVCEEEVSKTTIGTAHHNPIRAGNPPGILYNCKGSQVDRYLIPVVQGEKRTAMANTEPGAGSDAAAIRTTAVRDGDKWIINGTKLFSTMADTADFLTMTALTDKEKRGKGGITMFIVDTDTPGFSVAKKVPVIRPQYSTELVFDNVVLTDENVLGEVGQGLDLFKEWTATGRLKMAAKALGMAQRAHDLALEYAKIRNTFGQTLSKRQAIQWMLVDNALDLKTARLLIHETAAKIDAGQKIPEEASMCKLYSVEAAYRVLDRSIQIHGGMGLTKELPIERWFREVRVMRIVEGASEIQRMIIQGYLLR